MKLVNLFVALCLAVLSLTATSAMAQSARKWLIPTNTPATTADRLMVVGKPGGTLVITTAGCAKPNGLDNGPFTAGTTTHEVTIFMADSSAMKPDRMTDSFTDGIRPTNGKKVGTLTRWGGDYTCTEIVNNVATLFQVWEGNVD